VVSDLETYMEHMEHKSYKKGLPGMPFIICCEVQDKPIQYYWATGVITHGLYIHTLHYADGVLGCSKLHELVSRVRRMQLMN